MVGIKTRVMTLAFVGARYGALPPAASVPDTQKRGGACGEAPHVHHSPVLRLPAGRAAAGGPGRGGPGQARPPGGRHWRGGSRAAAGGGQGAGRHAAGAGGGGAGGGLPRGRGDLSRVRPSPSFSPIYMSRHASSEASRVQCMSWLLLFYLGEGSDGGCCSLCGVRQRVAAPPAALALEDASAAAACWISGTATSARRPRAAADIIRAMVTVRSTAAVAQVCPGGWGVGCRAAVALPAVSQASDSFLPQEGEACQVSSTRERLGKYHRVCGVTFQEVAAEACSTSGRRLQSRPATGEAPAACRPAAAQAAILQVTCSLTLVPPNTCIVPRLCRGGQESDASAHCMPSASRQS